MEIQIGEDIPVTPKSVYRLLKSYCERHPCGGSLHIYSDDGNARDCDLEFCVKWAAEREDYEGAHIAKLALALTERERERIYYKLNGIKEERYR